MPEGEPITLEVRFRYDITRGVYIGRVGAAEFVLVDPTRQAKPLANALEGLRHDTMKDASGALADRLRKAADRPMSDEDFAALQAAIARYEAKGGGVRRSTHNPVPKARGTQRRVVTGLSLDDLGELEL